MFHAVCACVAAMQAVGPALSLDTSRIREGTETFLNILLREGEEVSRTTLTRTIRRIESGDTREIEFLQTYDTPEGVTTDATVVDAADLRPRRYRSEVYGERQTLIFSSARATGQVHKAGASRQIDMPLPAGTFSAVAVELFYEALCLEPGVSAVLSLFNPPETLVTATIAITGESTVHLADGSEKAAWTATFDTGRGNPSRMWLARDSGQLLMIRVGDERNGFLKVRSDVRIGRQPEPQSQAPGPERGTWTRRCGSCRTMP